MAAPSGTASSAELAFGPWEALQISGTPPSPRYVTAILSIFCINLYVLNSMHLQFHAMLDIHCVCFYCMYCDFTLHGIILHCFDHIKFVGIVLGVHWWGTGSTCMGVQRSAWRMTQPCITRRCTCSTVSELCVCVCCSAERAQCHKVMYTRVCVCTHVGYMQYNILPFF